MNTEPHRIVGRSDTPVSEAKCIECKRPFKGGKKGQPGVNVYSNDGMREIKITGMCELCFDGLFDEAENEFCQCDLQLTEDEQARGKCAACGGNV